MIRQIGRKRTDNERHLARVLEDFDYRMRVAMHLYGARTGCTSRAETQRGWLALPPEAREEWVDLVVWEMRHIVSMEAKPQQSA